MAKTKLPEHGPHGLVARRWFRGVRLLHTTAGYKAYRGKYRVLSRSEATKLFPKILTSEVNYNGDKQKRSEKSARR